MTLEFVNEWTNAASRVELFLSRQLNDRNDVEDAMQQTAIRACRGYASFQRRSSFLTWVLRIARNESLRILTRRRVHQPLAEFAAPAPPPAKSAPLATEWTSAIAAAVEARFLTDQQAEILRRRLATDEASWEVLAVQLGLQANHCAVLHHRAVKNLRVYLFLTLPHILGRRVEIEQAFARAKDTAIDALTRDEIAAFRQAVLERSVDGSARGLLGPLRSACEKVARHLNLD